jgi:hypothetical protein
LRESPKCRLVAVPRVFQEELGLHAQTVKGIASGWTHDRNPVALFPPAVRIIRQQLGFMNQMRVNTLSANPEASRTHGDKVAHPYGFVNWRPSFFL